ncbi:hypothetical protein HS088_TW13G01639 [Tripterygium wilfordii]|uniref:Uncharacterized protein n=1 Tax=Tripterygium wilfordii TaxID=458696 RepID=A0A7J7CXK5_TRIWF|nr:hypothetical protein HS088_TW13G01639 [Tripterygium wilfordii]
MFSLINKISVAFSVDGIVSDALHCMSPAFQHIYRICNYTKLKQVNEAGIINSRSASDCNKNAPGKPFQMNFFFLSKWRFIIKYISYGDGNHTLDTDVMSVSKSHVSRYCFPWFRNFKSSTIYQWLQLFSC